eukprot:1157364-Pelagomonas_calceolata.AAC.6
MQCIQGMPCCVQCAVLHSVRNIPFFMTNDQSHAALINKLQCFAALTLISSSTSLYCVVKCAQHSIFDDRGQAALAGHQGSKGEGLQGEARDQAGEEEGACKERPEN